MAVTIYSYYVVNLFYAGLVDTIDLDLLCYVVLLVMPVLGRMSDQHRDVRLMASQCFAKLVTLMPLEVIIARLLYVSFIHSFL